MGKMVLFWLVWLLLAPLVLVVFLLSDLVNGRFRHPTFWVKLGLVRRSVWEQMGFDVRKRR
jgi:thiosulfate reductase cytochrome b subunit